MASNYPDLSIKDDWNARQSAPVTSLADDVRRANAEPTIKKPAELVDHVETSAGAVPADSEQAKAAADVDIKGGGTPLAILNPEKSESEAAAVKRVARTTNRDT